MRYHGGSDVKSERSRGFRWNPITFCEDNTEKKIFEFSL